MADHSQNQSFIPKAIPTKKRPQKPTRRIYLFTVISYVSIFSALLAAGSVFLYQNYMQSLLDNELRVLTTAINEFNEARMVEVLEFNERLSAAEQLLDSSFSVVALLDALEAATAGSVQLESLDVQLVGSDTIELSAGVITDTFDSTIFQRRFYEASDVIATVEINDVALGAPDSEEGAAEGGGSGNDEAAAQALQALQDAERLVSFELVLSVPRSDVPVTATSTDPMGGGDAFDTATATSTAGQADETTGSLFGSGATESPAAGDSNDTLGL